MACYFDRCLRCQTQSFVESGDGWFCGDCLGLDTLIDEKHVVRISNSVRFISLSDEASIDLGYFGTKESPREVVVPNVGRIPIVAPRRHGEAVVINSLAPGRTTRQYRARSSDRRIARLDVEFNLWYHDRFEIEEMYRFCDPRSNYYIEFHAAQDSGEVLWCNEERLTDHRFGEHRVPGVRLGEWPAVAHLTPDEIATMTARRMDRSIYFGEYASNFEEGFSVMVPGPGGLPWCCVQSIPSAIDDHEQVNSGWSFPDLG